MHYGFSYVMEEGLLTGALSGLLGGIPSLAVSVFTYVFTALSIYTIAKRRQLNNPWLSWIPVVNVWLLGSISDQYRYIVRGENHSRRKILLVLNIIAVCFGIMVVGNLIAAVAKIVVGAVMGSSMDQMTQSMFGTMAGTAAILVPWLGVYIAYTVIYYMALYDLYASCDPQNKTIFLVVSILVGICEPIFLFICRNKEGGMPPRRQPQPQYTAYTQYDEYN